MVEALVRMRFLVPQVWIGLDALGATFDVEWGSRVHLTLPENADTFSLLPENYPEAPLPSLGGAGPVFAEPGRDVTTAALILFEVTVEVESSFPALKPTEGVDELRHVAETELRAGMQMAQEVAGLFVRHLRAAAPRQSWLGLSVHEPAQYGIAQLEYRDTGERIFGLGPTQSVTMRSSRLRLDAADLDAVFGQISAKREPPIAESLLADAWHLSDAAAANDQDRATLVAAIACEVKVKQVIRECVRVDQRAMAELILLRRSNLPELVDEVFSAVLGVTLRKADPELFRKVRALATQRNAIVHGGRRDPQVKDAHTPAQIASSLFEWLEEIRASKQSA